ncbi:hypothetical protein [Lysinibacillus sp. NPDC096212]|uniref:hypothetical protein n=1 Tax=Lysinibacillus sp. NPDC096212 TaxID=3364135 RepID=UPI0037FEBC72
MTAKIIISLMILSGLVLMYIAIFSKNKDIEEIFLFGVTDLITTVLILVFNFSSIKLKRILLFLFGLLWVGLFFFIFITGEY